MEKDLKVSLETWKEIMTIKLDEEFSSVDAVIKDLLKGGKNEKKQSK